MTDFEDNTQSIEAEVSSEESLPQEDEGISNQPSLPENRTRRIIRSIFRWTISLLIAFSLGALVVYLAFLKPTARNLEESNAELHQTTQQVDSLTDQIDVLTNTNQELEVKLLDNQAHVMLLSTISDVRAANLAVINDDYAGALLSMRDATQSLEQLSDSIGDDQEEVIAVLLEKLSESEDMLKNDQDNAQMNLDRLTVNLIKLEDSIFK